MDTFRTPVTQVLPAGSLAESELTYVIIGARYRGQWIFVRHRERQTWELPAGHIEAGEKADQAAVRELYEEAGVVKSALSLVADYSVTEGEHLASGRLYMANVTELEPLPGHEIEEIKLCDGLPPNLTYPEVQTLLFSLLTLH